jgi:Icc-related predicted phosphoesterase
MKVLIAGDTHGAFWIGRVLAKADDIGADMAIVVGDCWDVHVRWEDRYRTPVKFVAGNHEQPLFWEAGVAKGRCLEDYSTFTIGGVKFGVIGKIDQDNHEHLRESLPWLYDALGPKPDIWMDKMPLVDASKLFYGVDVMLTHDGPSPMEFRDPEGMHRESGSKYLSDLLIEVKPKLLFHGHYHHQHTRRIGDTIAVGLDQQMVKAAALSMIVLDTDSMSYAFVPHLSSAGV